MGELHSPIQHLAPPSNHLLEEVLFEDALPLIFELPLEYQGKMDVYIYDMSTMTANIVENASRMSVEYPLVINVLGHPLSKK